MFIVLMIILGLITLVGFYLYDEGISDCVAALILAIGTIAELLLVLIVIIMVFIYPYNVNEKIKMYEEENIKIEEKVKETVKVYMNYEQDTYNNLVKDTDLTTLLIAYPDLNSNELVKSEIDLYI